MQSSLTQDQVAYLLHERNATTQFRAELQFAISTESHTDIMRTVYASFTEPVRKATTYAMSAKTHEQQQTALTKARIILDTLPENMKTMLGTRTPQSALNMFDNLREAFELDKQEQDVEECQVSVPHVAFLEGSHYVDALGDDFGQLPQMK